MKRVQLFEFEDLPWFGKTLRAGMTNLLNLFHKMTGLAEVIAAKLALELKAQQHNSIVDLGSGSGGVMPEVLAALKNNYAIKDARLIMTDLNPSPGVIKRFNNTDPSISYVDTSVDATTLSNTPEGIKTMLNSFHHMPPASAKKILQSAFEKKETLLIYELAENKIPTLLWALFLPIGLSILVLMSLFMTPFVRPMTFSQLFFTYIIPIIPLCYAWDGQASLPRIYTQKDLEELTKDLNTSTYAWRFEKATKANGRQLGYFFIGSPKTC